MYTITEMEEVLMEQRKVKALVLKWVNRTREKHGMDPIKTLPKGVRHDQKKCVLARALPGISCSMFGGPEMHRLIYEPKYARIFVVYFDNGSYPELETT